MNKKIGWAIGIVLFVAIALYIDSEKIVTVEGLSTDTLNVPEDDGIYLEFEIEKDADIFINARVDSGPDIDFFVVADDIEEPILTGVVTSAYSSDFGPVFVSRGQKITFYFDNSDEGTLSPPMNFLSDTAVVTYTSTIQAR